MPAFKEKLIPPLRRGIDVGQSGVNSEECDFD